MKFYHFSEMPYTEISQVDQDQYRGMRAFVPNKLYDPVRGYELYQRYLDEYELADELGFNLMLNEHHQSATGLQVSATMSAATIGARTRRGRLALLGIPLPHHDNPLHVAEEVAYLDITTGGRVDCGFVRGTPPEAYPSNLNPIYNQDQFYEAADLIVKAWTERDLFSWEGKFYNYRYVSVWPRPLQQPHPPVWVTASAPNLITWTAQHGYNLAFLIGREEDTAAIFRIYRRAATDFGLPEPGPDKFGSMVATYVADSEAKAYEVGRKLMWYFETFHPRQRAMVTPGFFSPHKSVDALRGKLGSIRKLTFEGLIDAGVVVCGTPDQVVKQITRLYEQTGVGHLLCMDHVGEMTSNEVRESMSLFAREVMPAVAPLGEQWEDDDIGWRMANDTTPIGSTLASSVS